MNLSKKLILALDFSDAKEALRQVQSLVDHVQIFKVGLELFTKTGPKIIKDIHKAGGKVFLDLKLNDIPNTVGRTCKVISDYDVFMSTIHCSGGEEMMKAAKRAVHDNKPLLVGVTVLTSLDSSLNDVMERAELAHRADLNGVVCGVHEVKAIKQKFGQNFITVTPGIRLDEKSHAHDQKRMASISEAIVSGSDFLVLGRAIFQTPNPKQTLQTLIRRYE